MHDMYALMMDQLQRQAEAQGRNRHGRPVTPRRGRRRRRPMSREVT
jgi:hypothetical protein